MRCECPVSSPGSAIKQSCTSARRYGPRSARPTSFEPYATTNAGAQRLRPRCRTRTDNIVRWSSLNCRRMPASFEASTRPRRRDITAGAGRRRRSCWALSGTLRPCQTRSGQGRSPTTRKPRLSSRPRAGRLPLVRLHAGGLLRSRPGVSLHDDDERAVRTPVSLGVNGENRVMPTP